ncbi:MAG: twin-arginine translocation signal domain-containing protein [Acidobacteria bacterium]|nr:twin-arginine translocation signal domain-containing protein [Acidobacteriota bacterium]
MDSKSISRRTFLKETGAGALGASVVLPGVAATALARPAVDYSAVPGVDRKQLFSAFGDTLIPTASGYAGYLRLEAHGITDEVMKGLTGIPADDLNVFNAAAMEYYERPFVELSEAERTGFLDRVATSFPPDTFTMATPPSTSDSLTARLPKEHLDKVQRVFRLGRVRVMTVFYQNFPQHRIERDADKSPLLPPGDEHQITNPNTSALVTGWDVANFPGPLSWEEEETRRAYWMKTHWHEEAR